MVFYTSSPERKRVRRGQANLENDTERETRKKERDSEDSKRV